MSKEKKVKNLMELKELSIKNGTTMKEEIDKQNKSLEAMSIKKLLKDFIQEAKRYWGFIKLKKQFKFAWVLFKKICVFIWKWKKELYIFFVSWGCLIFIFHLGQMNGYYTGKAQVINQYQAREYFYEQLLKESGEIIDIATDMINKSQTVLEDDYVEQIEYWQGAYYV